MEMTGEQQVPLTREKVWEALNDSEVLKACIPGCEEMERTSENEFKAKVQAAVGPVKSRFKGKMTLSDLTRPESYTLSFQGDGGASFVKGNADVKLEEQDGGQATRIGYNAKATVGGKLAQVGSRLVDGAARKMANEFFSNLTEHLGGSFKQPEEDKTPAATLPAASDQRVWWIGAAAVVVIVLLLIWLL